MSPANADVFMRKMKPVAIPPTYTWIFEPLIVPIVPEWCNG